MVIIIIDGYDDDDKDDNDKDANDDYNDDYDDGGGDHNYDDYYYCCRLIHAKIFSRDVFLRFGDNKSPKTSRTFLSIHAE